jgi:heat shock protein HtpX
VTHVDAVEACPRCDGRLTNVGDGPPWCTACEWNLDAFESPPTERATALLRRSHNLAFTLNARVFDELRVSRPSRPRWTWTKVLLTAVSVTLAVGVLAMVGGGIYLITAAPFGWKIVGLFLVLIGIELRPRVPRLRAELGRTERADAPALFSIIDEVAGKVGAPRIDLLVLDESYNAWCGRFGIRRRCVLGLGLPLWGALSADGRLALLGHELGHLVNGDP